ncbi:hypothetical protein Ddye_023069 [Dipteronia dyeriana]|uniref:non-specific serine/threonine protein kinase n=1 Tax=Dipteronia dyeriana TaxID=168575 RepID=A0AAD9TSF4_9ROSI|nr:hypothetical protein Ddye_023069 [Dipteronia dyeriana]
MLSFISYPTILPWCFSLLLIYSFSTLSTASLINTNETDRLALLAIKAQLQDPLGVMSSWNNSVPFCLWTGVSCGRRHQRVTNLDLRNQSLAGHLSPFIGNLSFLRSIRLVDNMLNGEIPHEVGRLYRLETLALSNNSFSGNIPTNLSHCSSLINFYAEGNNLKGEIPSAIGNLLKLEELYVGVNHLTGQIPASIGNLSALQVFNLADNRLWGTIPDMLGQLKRLTGVGLADNNFFGIVPASIYNLSYLEYFFLGSNRLHGNLPPNIGFTLPNLKWFVVANNDFTGSLPDSMSNSSNLVEFDVSVNNLKGDVSIDFSGFNNLYWLNMGRNKLGTGTSNDLGFVTSLINCSKLETFGLYENQFGGVLPHSIANLSTTIKGIAIGSNQISGAIPPGIGNLVNLTVIGMEYNQISGTIPHAIGDLKSLQQLTLAGNNLQGSIPSSLGNLTLLTKLTLDSNKLQGNIPSSLGNCQNLILLFLHNNKLTGIMPHQILGITTLSIGLAVSDNLLSGHFPLEVGNLKNLVGLDISNNMFSGKIPFTLGGCSSLEILYLQGNSFRGSIPPSFSSLKSMKELDLSSNHLSGRIPEYLEKLSFLESLNLSYNEFEGDVRTKGVFNNTKKFSLIGNKRLCGGIAELHFPLCHSKGSKKSEIPLLRVVIPVIATILILSLVAGFFVFFARRRKFANQTSRMLHTDEQFPMVSYAELSKATDEFSPSNMIGQGRYGSVYKGILGEDRIPVAVKVINLQQKGASKSFIAECEALRNIRHRNLIKIITLCSSIDFKRADFKALVYEYMQNGSLEEWLHQNKDQVNKVSNLSLIQRLNIAIDVASAIEYLHHHCQPPIVHGDLKPSNVLLDHDMVAHVGDFGLAKFLSGDPPSAASGTQSSSIGIKGTIGYVAPEYGMGSQVSIPGDVYSFGIFLLEMFMGKRPTDSMFINELTLHDFAKMSLPERVMEIVEPSLLLEETNNNEVENFERLHGEGRVRIEDCLVGSLRIGVLCSMESPSDRMEMTDVVVKLCAIRENFLSERIRDVRLSSQLT